MAQSRLSLLARFSVQDKADQETLARTGSTFWPAGKWMRLLSVLGPVVAGSLVALREHSLDIPVVLISAAIALAGWGLSLRWGQRSTGARVAVPDLLALLLLGPVPTALVASIQTGEVTTLSLAAGLPLGCLAAAQVWSRHLAQVEKGASVPGSPIASRLGVPGLMAAYTVALTTALIFPTLLFAAGLLGPWALIPLILAPLAVLATPFISTGTTLASAVRQSRLSRLTLLYALLYVVALAR